MAQTRVAKRQRATRAKFYKRCTNIELIEFLAARAGLFQTRGRKKDYYIKLLAEVDDAAVFHFLDLLPELRNLVYREVLTLDRDHHCFPQILATCKQVHQEADGILYGENTFNLRVAAKSVDGTDGAGNVTCGVHFMFGDRSASVTTSKPSFCAMSPQWHIQLTKIRRLDLQIDIDDNESLKTLNHYLYRLCSFLSGNKMEKVHVIVRYLLDPTESRNQLVLQALSPVTKIAQLFGLTVKGSFNGREFELMAAHPVRGGESVGYDAVARYETLLPQVQMLEVAKSTKGIGSAWLEVTCAADSLEEWRSHDDWMNRDADETFTQLVMDLERAIGHETIQGMLVAAADEETGRPT